MKLVNLKYPVMASWLREQGFRLDAPPFLSGAIEARKLLDQLSVEKEPLASLTKGYNGGIYNGPMFRRNYVTDREHGVPFLTSSGILLADLSTLPLLSKKDAMSSRLSYLQIREGMTLISCSGAIGRMAYTRPEMDGMWSSQDVLKVVPDPDQICPGYLYAFLSSKFGVPLVVGGTYGAIIQHIEPHHIANLPVPRLGEKIESEVHNLVQEAAELRTNAARVLREIATLFDNMIVNIDIHQSSPHTSSVSSLICAKRLDAAFHDPVVQRIRNTLRSGRYMTIGQFCSRIFLPGIFKRIHIEDPTYGAPYYTGASLFWLEPQPKGILSRKTSLFEQVRLTKGTILVQAFGQKGGLTGRSVWVGNYLDGACTTHMLVRLNAEELSRSAYLYSFLQSDAAYLQIACLPYGGSIPHLDEGGIATVIVPLLPDNEMEKVSLAALAALESRDRALGMERKARRIVESVIEEVA
jgi:type I restriction enzyme S subunit